MNERSAVEAAASDVPWLEVNGSPNLAAWLAQQPEYAAGVPEFAPRASYGHYLHDELTAVRAAAAMQMSPSPAP